MADIIEGFAPKTGDMYRCEKCELEIHITKGCDCEPDCAKFTCCGEQLKKVTEPEVMNPSGDVQS